ncbi:hypothetical protein FRC04_005299 [Tulasnella sp. 424]|nr:hypothetical protein FRC04_005299 [Tulasnella sp. 424]KAG8976411.1 hypothetical protein FRC05_003654 [Tulasnella sp. 425]
MEMFPRQESGVHPISDGPPKNTQASEVHLALARNADFIHKKLKATNPRPMNIGEWTKLKLAYQKSSASRQPVYDGASESEEESFSNVEDKDDEDMNFEPTFQTAPRRMTNESRNPSIGVIHDMDPFAAPQDEEIDELKTALDALELPPDVAKRLQTIKHRPTLSPNFQYHCPFNSLVAGEGSAPAYQCVFKVDLVRLTQEQLISLPQELRSSAESLKPKFDSPTLSVLLAVLLDSHITQHLKQRSGIQQASGLYEVEVPIRPAAAHLVAQSANIRRRFDLESSLIRYWWIVEAGIDDDEGLQTR